MKIVVASRRQEMPIKVKVILHASVEGHHQGHWVVGQTVGREDESDGEEVRVCENA